MFWERGLRPGLGGAGLDALEPTERLLSATLSMPTASPAELSSSIFFLFEASVY